MNRIMTGFPHSELPPIALTTRDADRLRNLAEVAAEKFPATAEFLASEVERAEILANAGQLRGLVTMGSEVVFRDDENGRSRIVTLVYPDEADLDAGKISVLTPIGAALIGLSTGQTIEFRLPDGRWRSITVVEVHAGADLDAPVQS